MSEVTVRAVLSVILSFGIVIGVINTAMWAWPDASLFTGPQAGCVLASMALWCFVGIRCVIRAVVGAPKQP